uniref:BED-type domain-containing protein n=1 Tax=Nothobranchius furzeri TaxID=105023 RepID=A0A8C6LH62_NOTFU
MDESSEGGELQVRQEVEKQLLLLLQQLRGAADSVPHVALLASGGGQRAAVGLVGTLHQMKEDHLLDTLLYIGGVSGSTWAAEITHKNKTLHPRYHPQRQGHRWQRIASSIRCVAQLFQKPPPLPPAVVRRPVESRQVFVRGTWQKQRDPKKVKTSEVWEHFQLNQAKTCNVCRSDLAWHGSTTVMMQRLKRKHVRIISEEGESSVSG